MTRRLVWVCNIWFGSQLFCISAKPNDPCAHDLVACLNVANNQELTAVYQWLASAPKHSYQSTDYPIQSSALDVATLSLFQEVGFAVLASVLDFIMLCRSSDPRCNMPLNHFEQVTKFQNIVDGQMAMLVQSYVPADGMRSLVLRFARHLRRDVVRFADELPHMHDANIATQKATALASFAGGHSRKLAQQLALHHWVRGLVVPGRGAPVFILHDEYTSWMEMAHTVIGNMVRNGARELSVAEIGVQPSMDLMVLMEEFHGMQYFGVFFDSDNGRKHAGDAGQQELFLRMRDKVTKYGNRAALHYSSSVVAASVIPHRALDIVFVRADTGFERVAQDLEWWEARVKPGGIIGGRNFGPDWPHGVRAICDRRFGNDIHVGFGGNFWWYVEPEE